MSLFHVHTAQTTDVPCTPVCHADATCVDGTCTCNAGFTGDGTICQGKDMKERKIKTNDPNSMTTSLNLFSFYEGLRNMPEKFVCTVLV